MYISRLYAITFLMTSTLALYSVPFYRVTIHNNTTQPLSMFYRRPDPGFSGMHVIINDHTYLKAGQHECIMISTKYPSILCALYSESSPDVDTQKIKISHETPPDLYVYKSDLGISIVP